MLDDGIQRLSLSSRWSRQVRMTVSVYVLGDLIVDSGFRHAGAAALAALPPAGISAVCCTHHHEDHTGNAGALQDRYGCPVFLLNPEARETEGLARLPLYRRLWWGWPAPYRPSPYPSVVEGRRRLRAVPTPGHSATHAVLFEEATGVVFTGDLFVSTGASAVMRHEDPWALAASLDAVAALSPRRMLTGHGLALEAPGAALRRKAARVRQAAEQVLALDAQGAHARAIAAQVFPRNAGRDRFSAALTGGEFSRLRFVEAVLRHRPVSP